MKRHFFLAALLCAVMNVNTLFADELEDRSFSDVQSMILRTDGKYDVLCKNGTAEIVTIQQIREDKVCGGTVPEPTLYVEAIFSRSEKDFFVLCKNKVWNIATAKAIQEGNVCMKPSCKGFAWEGACWFAGEKNQSCEGACSVRGLTYDYRTAIAGRDVDACAAVARGVLSLEGRVMIGPAGEGREFLGCHYFPTLGQLGRSTRSTPDAHHQTHQPICACK